MFVNLIYGPLTEPWWRFSTQVGAAFGEAIVALTGGPVTGFLVGILLAWSLFMLPAAVGIYFLLIWLPSKLLELRKKR